MTKQIPLEQAERLKLLLKPIAEMFRTSKISIIVRAVEGGNAEGDLIFSSDHPAELLKTLKRHMAAEAKRFAAEGSRSGQSPDAEFPKYRNLDEIR